MNTRYLVSVDSLNLESITVGVRPFLNLSSYLAGKRGCLSYRKWFFNCSPYLTESIVSNQDHTTWRHKREIITKCVSHCLPILTKMGMSGQMFVNIPKLKLHEKSVRLKSVCSMFIDRQTDRHDEADRRIYNSLKKAPTNWDRIKAMCVTLETVVAQLENCPFWVTTITTTKKQNKLQSVFCKQFRNTKMQTLL